MTKESSSLVKKPKLSDIVKTEAAVDMNSIVAFFISKYENSLLESKKVLSSKLTELNNYLNTDFVKEIETEANLTSFEVKVKVLGLITKAVLQLNPYEFENKKKIFIIITNTEDVKNCTFSMRKEKIVSDELHQKYMDTLKEISSLRTSLQETLDKLSNVSRKERELRGALAEKTLRDAGVGDLFEDETLLNMVSLPQLSMKTVS